MRQNGHRAHAVRGLLLLLLAALLGMTLVVVGCGSDATTTTSTVPLPEPSADTTTAGQGPQHTQMLAQVETPAEVSQALNSRTPVVILVYVPGGTDDEAVRASLTKLEPRYPDVTFAIYNYDDPQKLGDLTQQLGSHYPPFAAFVDKNGIVQYFTTGYADEAVFDQYVVNIRQL